MFVKSTLSTIITTACCLCGVGALELYYNAQHEQDIGSRGLSVGVGVEIEQRYSNSQRIRKKKNEKQ